MMPVFQYQALISIVKGHWELDQVSGKKRSVEKILDEEVVQQLEVRGAYLDVEDYTTMLAELLDWELRR